MNIILEQKTYGHSELTILHSKINSYIIFFFKKSYKTNEDV